MAGRNQILDDERTDESGGASDEYAHKQTSMLSNDWELSYAAAARPTGPK
jgi:hypothetical protein